MAHDSIHSVAKIITASAESLALPLKGCIDHDAIQKKKMSSLKRKSWYFQKSR